ncbi:MAG: transcription antitermination factor NusB [Candidatus Poribacteria bacterium]
MRKRTKARECALQMLYQADMTDSPIDEIIEKYWQYKTRTPDVISFANDLFKGTYEHLEEIDKIISDYSEHWKISEMPVVDRNILRFAIYEIIYMDDIPPAATIDEAVELANRFSTPSSGKFVNGILDKVMLANSKKLNSRF